MNSDETVLSLGVCRVIRSVVATGVGVLLIEQFATVALSLATRAHVMEGGVPRYSGTAAELKARPELLHSAYLLHGTAVAPAKVLDGTLLDGMPLDGMPLDGMPLDAGPLDNGAAGGPAGEEEARCKRGAAGAGQGAAKR